MRKERYNDKNIFTKNYSDLQTEKNHENPNIKCETKKEN